MLLLLGTQTLVRALKELSPQAHQVLWNLCLFETPGIYPLRSWKILYFCNRNCAIWWILLGENLEQAMSKKTQFFGPGWPQFCILGEIFDTILLVSLKNHSFLEHFFCWLWIFVKMSQNIVYIGHPPLSNIGGDITPHLCLWLDFELLLTIFARKAGTWYSTTFAWKDKTNTQICKFGTRRTLSIFVNDRKKINFKFKMKRKA